MRSASSSADQKKNCHNEHVKSLMQWGKLVMGIHEDSCHDIRVISPRLRNWGCLTSRWGTVIPKDISEADMKWPFAITNPCGRCHLRFCKETPTTIDHWRIFDALRHCGSTRWYLAPSTLALCPYGLWPMQTFFSSWFFRFFDSRSIAQHGQLPGHPDTIKSLMDSAEVPLVSIGQMIKEPGEVLYNPPKSLSSRFSGWVKIIPTVAHIPVFVLDVSSFETMPIIDFGHQSCWAIPEWMMRRKRHHLPEDMC